MQPFEDATYQSQIYRLRQLGIMAIKNFDINVKKIELKRYAANAVFKVSDSKGNYYQLRILPNEWHTQEALLEEIKWLKKIDDESDIKVPKPIPSKMGNYIIECKHPLISSSRQCELFTWLSGKKRGN